MMMGWWGFQQLHKKSMFLVRSALSELLLFVDVGFEQSIKCESPFGQSAYQGSGPLVHSRKSLWDMRKPRIWLLHRPDFPRHRAWYMPAIPDELRSVLPERYQPKSHSWWFPPTWEMDCSTSDAILPPSSFPRLAGESGTNVPTFLKTVQEFLQWSNAQPRTCHFPSFRRIPIIHHIRYTSMWSFSHTVMKYCRVWKLKKSQAMV